MHAIQRTYTLSKRMHYAKIHLDSWIIWTIYFMEQKLNHKIMCVIHVSAKFLHGQVCKNMYIIFGCFCIPLGIIPYFRITFTKVYFLCDLLWRPSTYHGTRNNRSYCQKQSMCFYKTNLFTSVLKHWLHIYIILALNQVPPKILLTFFSSFT